MTLILLLAACIDVSVTKLPDEDTGTPDDTGGADTAPDTATDTADDCAQVETPYNGVDDDCDAATPDDDLDGDGAVAASDCDDADPARHPSAAEACNGVDDDCDGQVDDVAAPPRWYADADGDGYGDAASAVEACEPPAGYLSDAGDCDDADAEVNPLASDVCNGADDDCDGTTDEEGCDLGYGGHRVEKDGDYYYALYNDRGFGIIGARDWYGKLDSSSGPEGVTWNEDLTVFYYNDLAGNVWAQREPFGDASTLVGSFRLGQVGGGVVYDGTFYTGDYANADIHAMDTATGATHVYATHGGSVCKPYFGNSAMAIDVDGKVYAASSCGVVVYEPGTSARMLNAWSGLISAVAMDRFQNLYGLDSAGNLVQFDKTTGAEVRRVTITYAPSVTWTLAFDSSGDVLVNYWGEQRLYSGTDGRLLTTWSASTYYPGTTGYYWYVTF